MGIKGLSKFLQKFSPLSVRKQHISDFRGCKVAVDVSGYLYQYAYNASSKGKGSHIRGFCEMIVSLISHGILPIMVFDGKAPTMKKATIDFRKQQHQQKMDKVEQLKSELLEPDLDSSDFISKQMEIDNINKNIIHITADMIDNLKILFELSGIPYFVADGEADWLCAKLCIDGIAKGVISDDMDMLAHGSHVLIRGINDNDFRKQAVVTTYTLNEILAELKINYPQFVDVCILAECDYTGKLEGIAATTGYKLILKHFCIESIIESQKLEVATDIFDYIGARTMFNKASEQSYNADMCVKQPTNSSELIDFLTAYSNYTPVTARNKAEIINCFIFEPKIKQKIVIKLKT